MVAHRKNTGDDGKTGLLGEDRLPKFHPLVEMLGDLDEVSANLGLARSLCQVPDSRQLLIEVQRDLYTIMTEIAAMPGNAQHFKKLDSSRVDWLEAEIQSLSSSVPLPVGFILPGDSSSGAALDLARTTVRRAERRAAAFLEQGDLKNWDLLKYLNRLSFLCFVLELLENQCSGHTTLLAKK